MRRRLSSPYALTPAELQELTDYGLKYHVQLIPYLDGPAHDRVYSETSRIREVAGISGQQLRVLRDESGNVSAV